MSLNVSKTRFLMVAENPNLGVKRTFRLLIIHDHYKKYATMNILVPKSLNRSLTIFKKF